MDCAAEESEIRRAVDGVPGVRGLRFQLGARLLTIDADAFKTADGNLEASLRMICEAVHAQDVPAFQ